MGVPHCAGRKKKKNVRGALYEVVTKNPFLVWQRARGVDYLKISMTSFMDVPDVMDFERKVTNSRWV